jgi:hypothetical protein
MWFMENHAHPSRTAPRTPLLHKLCTRSSPQIKKEDLLTRSTLPRPGTSRHFGSRDGLLVNNRRHVVMGHLVDDGDNKPTWLLEFELEWLFT